MSVLSQTYLDYVSPAIAAGAFKKGQYWHKRGIEGGFGFIQTLCRETGIEPVKVEPPKGRTFKAIRKAVRNVPAEQPTGLEHQAMRAVQYMKAMQGVETTHRQDPYGCKKLVRWDKAEDGSKRVRFVQIDDEWLEVPHWDFVAKIEVLA